MIIDFGDDLMSLRHRRDRHCASKRGVAVTTSERDHCVGAEAMD